MTSPRFSASNAGQAMAEFVVMVAGALLLLFVLVPVVAKLSDMAFTAQELARYAAWERTVWFDPGNTPGETQEGDVATRSNAGVLASAETRILSFSRDPVAFTAQDIDGAASGSKPNRFWRWTHGNNGTPMLAAGNLPATASINTGDTPSLAYDVIGVYNSAMGGVMKVLSFLRIINDEDFMQIAHPTENFYTVGVNLPVPLAGGNLGDRPLFGSRFSQPLNVNANAAVLADGWNAQGDHHFKERADDFAVGTMLSNPLIDTIISVIGIFEPSFKDVEFDYIGIEPIPDTKAKCNTTTGFCYFE